MTLEFTSLLATDKVRLPALLYTPDGQTQEAAIWLHGMGDNGIFYKPTLINALGQSLTAHGCAFLALNNRGAHGAKRLAIVDEALPEEDRSYQGGTYYEKIADSVYDIDGAINYLQGRGFKIIYLIGHSSGANKICVYHAARPQNPVAKYVLAGPGDDVGVFFTELGPQKFQRALHYATTKLRNNPLAIMPKYTGMYPFSVQAAADILNPDGDYNTFPYYEATHERLGQKKLFSEYSTIDKPLQIIFGENDEYCETASGPEEALKLFLQNASNSQLKQIDTLLLREADHSFHEHEVEFAEQVSRWVTS